MRVALDLSHIQADDTIIVANNRQALAFKHTILKQLGTNKAPKIFSYSAFLKKTWSQLNPQSPLRLLSDSELRILFQEIIDNSKIQNPSGVTDEVIKCYRLMKSYFISNESIAQYQSAPTGLFIDWLKTFSRLKKQSQTIDSSDLFSEINKKVEQSTALGNYYHYGINNPTPEQCKLFDLLKSQALTTPKTKNAFQALSFPTIEQELSHIAQWSKKKSQNSEHKIAIVIPNLRELQQQVNSIFNEVFNSHGVEVHQKPFNISLGSPLSSYPLMRHLFNLIELSNEIMQGSVESEKLCRIIPSPYINGAKEESNNRQLLINTILGSGKDNFTIQRLKQLMDDCPILKQQITNISQIKNKQQASSEDWLEFLYQLLNIWSFASDRTLSSSEYQLFEKFQKESLILNQIPVFKRQITFDFCIDLLKKHFDSVIFQAQGGDANIHILGALEAEGLYFDAAWVVNMTNEFLPGVVKFPLFIPSNICSEFRLPNATFELLQNNAIDTLNALKRLGDNLNFSYAETNNGREQIATPMLCFQPCVKKPLNTIEERVEFTLEDNCAPQLENSSINQGVQTLQDQMSCPFKGFVRRLNIQELRGGHQGLDKAEQGILIHKILETLFAEISNSKILKSLSEKSINQLVENHTIDAIGSENQHYQSIEKERIIRIINQYLTLERQRSDFEVIETESVAQVSIEGLNFSTKLDRMDQLPNGDKLIIDYKTGKTELGHITGETIQRAQLPIYAISNEVDGVAFAQITASECGYKAVSKDREAFPSSKQAQNKMPDWDEQLNAWKLTLAQASLDYQQGVAAVAPTKTACDYCDYELLCRVEKTLNHG